MWVIFFRKIFDNLQNIPKDEWKVAFDKNNMETSNNIDLIEKVAKNSSL